ncbi:IS630 family transposase [Actinomadura opuntiae]|uniref:IS630 family transposase n=1 Tax=Actinomadura sp. OS1-43 TaxID=604315 RepID=UPI00255AC1DD|nr:IS630 family transposase [Actinomadura sp. OS1-43]MDL4820153.1 IS630 family transposase [Actinomadura sp. OS1-43]
MTITPCRYGKSRCGRRWNHRGDLGAWICFLDETGQGLRPPKGRSWSRRGHRPQVRVRGGEHGARISVAGMVCYRPGKRSRLIYRLHHYRRRKGERAAFTLTEYKNMLNGARQQLPGGKIVLVWDNLNIHHSTAMRAFIDAHTDWLTVFHLPAYAPELNPTESVWSLLKRSMANSLAADLNHLTRMIKHRLKVIQNHPDPIDGCLTTTDLTITTTPAITS